MTTILDFAQRRKTYRQKQTRKHKNKGFRLWSLKDLWYIGASTLIVTSFGFTILNNQPKHDSVVNVVHAEGVDGLSLGILLSPTPTDTWAAFVSEAKPIAKMYNFPLNLLLSQAALESAHGTSAFARERNNYFGIGAYGKPDEAFDYENVEQTIVDYIYVIKDNFPEAWSNRNNPEQMLRLLKENSRGMQYATDPEYVEKVMSEPEWSVK